MTVCLSVCLYVPSGSFTCMGLKFFKRAREPIVVVHTLRNIKNSGGGGVMSKEPMWTFDINDAVVTSPKRFMKAVVNYFWSVKLSLPLALDYQSLTGPCKES